MAMSDLSILAALKVKMKWHEGRQRILSENVANADTPRFQARDLKTPTFRELVEPSRGTRLRPLRTDVAHLDNEPGAAADWQLLPQDAAVVLEEEMLKMSENQMDYQLVTTLYSRSLGLLRAAVSRRG